MNHWVPATKTPLTWGILSNDPTMGSLPGPGGKSRIEGLKNKILQQFQFPLPFGTVLDL